MRTRRGGGHVRPLVDLARSHLDRDRVLARPCRRPEGPQLHRASRSYYAASTKVPLVAKPSAGYVFSSWTASPVAVASAGSASTRVTMGTATETVTANFISALTVSPSPSYSFGTVYLGSLTTENFTVTNTGTTPITITGPLISIVKGGDSNEFVEVNQCPKSLAGGSHCTISGID